jgi:NAD(P)-dependent dehydrogenase (short-subunit alcohol dehydrogenase family)
VTGGARGIGRTVAEAYAVRGGRIGIPDRDTVVDAPAGWLCVRGSAANAGDIERAVTTMERAWGGVDVAHANAGVSANNLTLELTEAEWRHVLDVNLTGVLLTAQATARRMVSAGPGVILATSSIYGLTAAPNHAAYTATKGAVSNLVRALASE